MLDNATKRKIDSARQILVGKVPDPKAQVEQITTALVYKFMDDMDKESEELGGEARFFANGFSQYSWTKLMDNRLSGQERLELYAEAIANMSKNPHIPQLFRDIFKGAFLPFRDPRTLTLFLKEINEFNYDHSENLGNAFEYLLSILGSQGDAGQFRTPRHIIDFIVEVVNPQKHETILDPACGTAGFLISAYKHILKTNSSNFKPEEEKDEEKIKQGATATETVIEEKQSYKGDLLTPDERTRLMNSIAGYDISPDMVKLSLVNMYLHGFQNPKIHEYDSLTSEKRWDEMFDVIMANPPFMTPKGGINPHKRFAVQSSRAEVLFLDYIMEHLNINGRAGVVIPEGVLGNSNASYYKKLRAFMIDSVWAVVQLHSFTFAPYAEVNSYILFFDKEFSKKNKDVVFINIENDGFDKSSQRRFIDKNDLPNALKFIRQYKNEGKGNDEKLQYQIIPKEKIKNNPQHYFLQKKYQQIETPETDTPVLSLGELIEERKEKAKDKKIQVWSVSNKYGFVNSEDYFDKKIASADTKNYKVVKPNYFAFNPSRVNVGSIACNFTDNIGIVSPMYTLFEIIDTEKVLPEYLLMYLKSDVCKEHINFKIQGATRKVLKKDDLFTLQIPVPKVEKQRKLLEKVNNIGSEITILEKDIEEKKSDITDLINNIWFI